MNTSIEHQFLYYHEDGRISYSYIIHQSLYIDTIQQGKTIHSLVLADHIIDYALAIDEQGFIHLVSISGTGELEYWICHHNQWKTKLLTTYDIQTQIFKNLKIYIDRDKIHILVAVSNIIHPELWILKHHYWSNHTWFNKKVCEIVSGKYESPYHSDMDIHKNIHIVYKSLSKGNYHIFYAKFNAAHNMWNIPQNISSDFIENHHPFIFCDQTKGVHILWSGIQNNSYQINYLYNKNNISVKRGWSDTIHLSLESANCTHPYMLQIDNELIAIWKENDKFRISKSHSLGKNWTAPCFVEVENPMTFQSISVLGKTYKNFNSVKIIHSLGYLYNDFYIMGVDTIDTQEENQSLTTSDIVSPDTFSPSQDKYTTSLENYIAEDENRMDELQHKESSSDLTLKKDNSLSPMKTAPVEDSVFLIKDKESKELLNEILKRLDDMEAEQKLLVKDLYAFLECHKEQDVHLEQLVRVVHAMHESMNHLNNPPMGIFRSLFK